MTAWTYRDGNFCGINCIFKNRHLSNNNLAKFALVIGQFAYITKTCICLVPAYHIGQDMWDKVRIMLLQDIPDKIILQITWCVKVNYGSPLKFYN